MVETKTKSPIRKIVVPGEFLAENNRKIGANVFKEEGKIYSSVLGVYYPEADVINVVPLKGHYSPRKNDIVIGIVVNETYNAYEIDIGTSVNPYVLKEYIRGYLKIHDIVSAQVYRVDEVKEVELRNVRLLRGGYVLTFTPVKAPRFIGKNNSMLDLLKKYTNCQMILGMNGRIWVKDGDTELLKKALNLIESSSHKPHLTTKVEEMLKGDNK